MEQTATFSKSRFPGENAALMAMTASGRENVFREKSLQHIGLLLLTTGAYGTTSNAPTNATIANQCIIIQCTTNYEEHLSGAEDTSGVFFVSLSDLSSVGEATLIHTRNRYGLSERPCQTLGYPEVQIRYELVPPPESPWMAIHVIGEEQETIRADTNRALSFKDLMNALDRISHPTEIEDIPLPFDPDDYPVV